MLFFPMANWNLTGLRDANMPFDPSQDDGDLTHLFTWVTVRSHCDDGCILVVNRCMIGRRICSGVATQSFPATQHAQSWIPSAAAWHCRHEWWRISTIYVYIYVYIYMCIYIYMYICIYIYVYVYIYICMYTYIYMYIMYISLYLSIYLSIYLSSFLSFFLSIYLSIYRSIYLSIYIYRSGFPVQTAVELWNRREPEGNPKGTPKETRRIPEMKPEGFRKYHHIITSDFCLLRRSWISQAGAALLFHNKKDTTDENPIGWMNTQVWPPIFDRRPSWPLVRHSIERWSKGEWPRILSEIDHLDGISIFYLEV